jgi:hypothetical protein
MFVSRELGTPEFPRARRDGLLERASRLPFGDDENVEAGRQRTRQARRQGDEIDIVGGNITLQLDVEVFGDRFGAGGQRQTEADL